MANMVENEAFTLTWDYCSEREVQIEVFPSLFLALNREAALRREGYIEIEILVGDLTAEDVVGE